MKGGTYVLFAIAVWAAFFAAQAFAQHIGTDIGSSPEERRLIRAIVKGDLDKVQRLTDSATIDFGEIVGYCTLECPNADVVEYLRENFDLDISDLEISVIRGDVMAVGHLLGQLDTAARDDALGRRRENPFHTHSLLILASRNGHVDVVRELIAQGANVHEVYRYTHSPLASAAERGHLDVVRLLLEAGVDVDAIAEKKDNFGDGPYTALMRACIGGQSKTVRILLEAGADPNVKRDDGQRALHFAATRGDLACVKLLLKYGADVDAQDHFKRTPSLNAKWHRREDVAAFLQSVKDK